MSKEVVAEVIALIELGMIAPEDIVKCLRKANSEPEKALAGNVKETQKIEHEPAQQELVVFCMHWEDRWGCNHYADPKEPHPINAKPLYTSPPAQQDIQRLSALVRAQQITIDKLEAQQEPVYVYTCKGCQALFWENDLSCDCTVNGLFDFNRHILLDCTSPPAQRKPLTEQMMTKTALWDLVVSKGLVTIHSEQLAPGTWSAHLSVASWIEGHAKSCDISNEAAHGIKENT